MESPTASTTAGRLRIDAGVVSRLLPPWFDADRGRSDVDHAQGIVNAQDALQHEGPVPLLAQPGEVVP